MVDGDLYHFNPSGAMESGKWVDCGEHDVHWWMEPGNYAQWKREYMNKRDKRYIGSDGVAYTGWHQIDGDWYYFYTVEDADNNYDHDYSIVGLVVYGDFTDWSDES